VGLP
jgi:hypothetical protein